MYVLVNTKNNTFKGYAYSLKNAKIWAEKDPENRMYQFCPDKPIDKSNKKQKCVLIYDCNAWQEFSSMRLIMVSSEDELANNLAKIQKDRHYNNDEMNTYIYQTTEIIDAYE